MPSELVSLPRTPIDRFKAVVYLVETRSWGGHSGSPVFWQYEFATLHPAPGGAGLVQQPQHSHLLIGLLSGHFDEHNKTIQPSVPKAERGADLLADVRVRQNTGMAYVTPAEAIRELLMRADVVEDRSKAVAALPENPDGGPTMDTVEAASEFENFENLTGRLLRVPKKELEDKLKES